jgi:FkbM family methyltransferase
MHGTEFSALDETLQRMESSSRLVFDIGLHNGSDTAHYLDRGFDVVAVEANPTLAEDGRKRFADAIRSGRLMLIEAGIAKEAGRRLDFYINETDSEWSSLLPSLGQRGGKYSTISVPTITMAELLRRYGTPYYMKIDVEGADWFCLNDIAADNPPQYVSVEAHRLEYLAVLYAKGYRRFKLVNQTTHIGFVWGSSGPISDAITDWECLETVAYDWLHMALGKAERSSLYDGWFDFHAALGGEELVRGVAKPPLPFGRLRRKAPRILRRIRRIPGAIRRRLKRLVEALSPQ